jgi:hypothetical protein
MMPGRRNRIWLALAVLVVIGAGLASRKFPSLLPAFGSQTGDALWALMVFLGIAFLRPAMSGARVACTALAFSYLIEIAQLYQAPWINAIRATTFGHLVLGTGFQWLDLLAYTLGIAFGYLCDRLYYERRP